MLPPQKRNSAHSVCSSGLCTSNALANIHAYILHPYINNVSGLSGKIPFWYEHLLSGDLVDDVSVESSSACSKHVFTFLSPPPCLSPSLVCFPGSPNLPAVTGGPDKVQCVQISELHQLNHPPISFFPFLLVHACTHS